MKTTEALDTPEEGMFVTQAGRDTRPCTVAFQSPTQEPQARRSTWRRLVRWISRALLPVVWLLSSAQVVRIRDEGTPAGLGTVLLVVAHSRAQYLEECLDSVTRYHPRNHQWRVVISLDRQDDMAHPDVDEVAQRFARSAPNGLNVSIWAHEACYESDLDPNEEKASLMNLKAYRSISRHYEWALARVFRGYLGMPPAERVVVLEDDLAVAPDFFSYFDQLAPLLDLDDTLFCISAWNDNGKQHLSRNLSQLHRTDIFPGLGWMIRRQFWDEIKLQWPKIFWDDWLRSEKQTRGRQCIRPEVSRTRNFGGEGGASQMMFHSDHVGQVVDTSFMLLCDESPCAKTHALEQVNALDLSYLEANAYEQLVFGRMSNATLLRYSNYLSSRPQDSDVIARFPPGRIDAIARRTGIMADHREGRFRTSYRGVVIVPWNGHWAFFVDKGFQPPAGYRLGRNVV